MEPRMKAGARYVGLSATNQTIFSCTSNGALRIITAEDNSDQKTTSLPTRLCDWRLSKSHETFAYGGDEVDLSVWSTEKAFSTETEPTTGQKRKRDALFPGEVWRAKNVPNDHLGLRKPIRITSLSYVRSLESQFLVGTQLGSMRRYDTRAARRPVADWNDVARVGGVKAIECGLNEHEAFVSDGGSNLFSLDLRNGRISYAYKGISGAVTSIAPSTSVMATVAQDRFIRIHSVHPPPMEVGKQQKQKDEVLDKIYAKIMPTVIVWDQCTVKESSRTFHADEDYEDVWNGMEEIGDDSDGEHSRRHKKRLQ
ncbi:hypothetical protein Moror_6505 [Moniliophthora roreri MCA 2997]|nr:hypothetical protein Moror_6505 [Moniliophthora roreri MCA 2997]